MLRPMRSPRLLPASFALFAGCAADPGAPGAGADSAAADPSTAWSRDAVPAAALPAVRGQVTRRGIVHLHTPWSHDACDGDGLIDGQPDPACLDALRDGLCAAGIDVAWVTDHPSHAAAQPFADRLLVVGPDDAVVTEGGETLGARWACSSGAVDGVLLRPGYEDDLMPVGLRRPLSADPAEEDALASSASAASIAAMHAAGGDVLVAHTEGKELGYLESLVDQGVAGVEVFSLHAAFDPRIRQDDLGLDPLGWTEGLTTFTAPTATAQPDLLVTGALEEQAVSIARWDALQARGRVVGTAGSDAHQNVLPSLLADGERGDSYRRSLRWMSQHLRLPEGADPDHPEALQAALIEGRSAVVLEILGAPAGWDVRVEAPDGAVTELGEAGPGGTLEVVCPTLAAGSPRGPDDPDIHASVFKDGALWAEGCGPHETDGPGAYRVRFDLTPHHLRPFYGDDPDPWITRRPWMWTQHVRVR